MALKVPQPKNVPQGVLEAQNAADVIERELILGMVKFYHFYLSMREVLCPYDATTASYRSDFSIDRYNILYKALDQFYRRYDHKTDVLKSFGIPMSFLRLSLNSWIGKGNVPLDMGNKLLEELDADPEFFDELTLDRLEALAQSVQFQAWLQHRLTHQAYTMLSSQKQLGKLTIENLKEAFTTAEQSSVSMRTDRIIKGGTFVRGKRLVMPSVHLNSFPKLMTAIGGGFFWGDSTLIAANNAGGKTLLAMQMADEFISMGYRVAVFTTERRPDELFVRSACNRMDVNIARMTKMHVANPLEPTEQAYLPEWIFKDPKLSGVADAMETEYNQFMRYIDWSRGEGMNAIGNFEPEMAALERSGFDPHVVVFDWIGGGIDATKDSDKLRHLYSGTAEVLISHGKRTNRIMISMAQLDKNKATGHTKFITQSMIAESKAMLNNQTNFIGLTMLLDSKPGDDTSAVQRKQNMCLAKSTRGLTGQMIPIELQFEYQRVKEINRMQSAGGG